MSLLELERKLAGEDGRLPPSDHDECDGLCDVHPHGRIPFESKRRIALDRDEIFHLLSDARVCGCGCVQRVASLLRERAAEQGKQLDIALAVEADRRAYYDLQSEPERSQALWKDMNKMLKVDKNEEGKLVKSFQFVLHGVHVCLSAWVEWHAYSLRTVERAMSSVKSSLHPPADRHTLHTGHAAHTPKSVDVKTFFESVLQEIQHIDPKHGHLHLPPMDLNILFQKYCAFMDDTAGSDFKFAVHKGTFDNEWRKFIEDHEARIRTKPDTK